MATIEEISTWLSDYNNQFSGPANQSNFLNPIINYTENYIDSNIDSRSSPVDKIKVDSSNITTTNISDKISSAYDDFIQQIDSVSSQLIPITSNYTSLSSCVTHSPTLSAIFGITKDAAEKQKITIPGPTFIFYSIQYNYLDGVSQLSSVKVPVETFLSQNSLIQLDIVSDSDTLATINVAKGLIPRETTTQSTYRTILRKDEFIYIADGTSAQFSYSDDFINSDKTSVFTPIIRCNNVFLFEASCTQV